MKRKLQMNKWFLMAVLMVLVNIGFGYGVCRPGVEPCYPMMAKSSSQGSYQIMGSIMGLQGTLLLSNNGVDVLSLNGNGMLSFRKPLASGTAYRVMILSQPANQTCQITNAYGVVNNANVMNVLVNCTTNAYTVNGLLKGLTVSESVRLQNNNQDNLILSANGFFAFRTPVTQGSPYLVSVVNQPPNETCSVLNGTGVMQNFNVMNVQVSCVLNLKRIIR